jgi:hypothetical protein
VDGLTVTKPRPLRRAGARWRLLVHRYAGGGRPIYDHAYNVQSEHWGDAEPAGEHSSTQVLVHTELDELVCGSWLHLEQYDVGRWSIHVGGVRIGVHADRDGRPLLVDVFGPGCYLPPVEGCRYELMWDDE